MIFLIIGIFYRRLLVIGKRSHLPHILSCRLHFRIIGGHRCHAHQKIKILYLSHIKFGAEVQGQHGWARKLGSSMWRERGLTPQSWRGRQGRVEKQGESSIPFRQKHQVYESDKRRRSGIIGKMRSSFFPRSPEFSAHTAKFRLSA